MVATGRRAGSSVVQRTVESSFCDPIPPDAGTGRGPVSPGRPWTPFGIRKEVRMAEAVLALTLLVALLVIDRLADR
jgi:hypothetical protein